jgi:phage tail-like protein
MADKQDDINVEYPISVFRYVAKIGDDDVFFSEISGLSMEYESTEYKEATLTGVRTVQVIGQRNTPTLTMKRGLFKDGLALYEWFNSTHDPKFEKKDVVISLLDNQNNAIMTWSVANAFCSKFEGPSLDAKSNDVAFQSIDLKADSIIVANA